MTSEIDLVKLELKRAKGRERAAKRRLENPEAVAAARKKYRANGQTAAEKVYQAKWRAENPEKQKEISNRHGKKWREANPEKQRERVLKWRTENPEKFAAILKRWEETNKERRLEISRAWWARNPEASRISCQNRRALRLNNGGKLSKGLAEKLFASQDGKCTICTKSIENSFHMDHIMPLFLGGANLDENIQLLCPPCNRRKSNKHPDVFAQEVSFLGTSYVDPR